MDDISLEEQLELGLITGKGYNLKRSLNELDEDFKKGDITRQGLVNKKKKLYEEVVQVPSEELSTSESPSSIYSVATALHNSTALSNSSVHTALNKLFNKKPTTGGKGGRFKNKDLLSLKKKPAASSSVDATVRTSPAAKEKPITVVMIEGSEAMTIPKDKAKLRSSGMLKLCMLSSQSSNEDITSKISQIFGKAVTIMLATKSGELFDAPNDMSGERLLDIIGNSYLYVRSAAPLPDAVTDSSEPQKTKEKEEVNLCLVKQELRDLAFLRSCQEDTLSHVPDRDEDDDLAATIKRNDGDTLLCRNYVSDLWNDCLKEMGIVLQQKEHFYIVSEENMILYDKFRDDLKKMKINGCLRRGEVVKLFIQTTNVPFSKATLGSRTYFVLSYEDMDKFYEFMLEQV